MSEESPANVREAKVYHKSETVLLDDTEKPELHRERDESPNTNVVDKSADPLGKACHIPESDPIEEEVRRGAKSDSGNAGPMVKSRVNG